MMPGDVAGQLGDGGFITISINIDGRAVVRKLATWGADVRNLSPALEQVGNLLLRNFYRQFEAQGGTYGRGSSWKPLAASTVKDRLRKGYFGPAPILFRSGMLAYSVSERGMPGNIFRVTPTTLTVGTDVFYAIFHQLGTRKSSSPSYGRRKTGEIFLKSKTTYGMPPRKIVGASMDQMLEIVRTINAWVQAQAAAAWGS